MRILALSAFAASVTFSQAGESFSSPKSTKQAIVPAAIIPKASACPECLTHSGLFVGAGIDYLFDNDAAFYNGRVGYEWGSPTGTYSQSVFLEAGFFDSDEDFASLQVVPITINYQYKRALTRCLSFYVGGGLGVAFTDASQLNDPSKKAQLGAFSDDNDTLFFAQAFAGLTYCLTEGIELYAGARYIYSGDVSDGDGLEDLSIGGGLLYKF